jgi:16S rRNA processing protein RimM
LATDWRPERARLGAVGRAHGLDGSFRVEGAVDWFSYARGERVLVAGAERRIAARRGGEGTPLVLRLQGLDGRDAAEALHGAVLEIELERLPEPEEEAFWVFDLVGCDVVCEGRVLGCVREVLERPANDVLVVEAGDEELLVPFTRDAVTHVDVVARRLELRPDLLADEEE